MGRRTLGIVKARWFIGLIGAALAALIVWFVAPLIAFGGEAEPLPARPFGSVLVRSLLIAGILLVWALLCVLGMVRRRRNARKLEEGLTAAAPGEDASAEEAAILRERMEAASGLLKRSAVGRKVGRDYLYQLPWYVIIGPPGSGKTTALVKSGLRFPLGEGDGARPVGGIGGTRHCDWWFSDEAVLLDTAGRYTTQDSNKAVDSAGWTSFLRLLKRTRPRQPVNGAIVAISLSDLASAGESDVLAHAGAVKQRLRELRDELGVRFPVYVLFTKADLIAGFVEFFDDLDADARQQVWGMTFELDEGSGEGGAVAGFAPEFAALVKRLEQRALERMHQEVDIERRALIFGFAAQIASLRPVAERFLEEIFRPSRLEARFLLRGVYLTSGTQEGTPIDRLIGGMAAGLGLDRQRLAAFRGSGRSYFLGRLMRDVVFAEAGLVNTNRKVESRQRVVWYAAAAAMAVLLVGAAVVWFGSYAANQTLIAETEASVAEFQSRVDSLPEVRPETPGLREVLPALDIVRNLPGGYARRDERVPLGHTFGLYQGDGLGSQAVPAYHRALDGLLRPRLLARLEEQLRINSFRAEYLFEALKTYLMLAGEGPLDRAYIRQWMQLDWASAFPEPAAENAEIRAGLGRHLDAMLERMSGTVPHDTALVEATRRLLNRTPLPERAYGMIRQSEAARNLKDWRLDEAAGPGADKVLRRASGAPLTDGVPGLYTVEGYHRSFYPALVDVIRAVAEESWVLGEESRVTLNPIELDSLQKRILGLYLDDYIAQWSKILSDLTVPSLRNLSQGADFLNIASSGGSPLRRVLSAIARQTTLTQPPGGTDAAAGKLAAAAGSVAAPATTPAGRLAAVVGAAAPPAGPPPEARVDEHFRALHAFVGAGGTGPAPIEDAFRALDGLYEAVAPLAMAPPGSTAGAIASGGPPKLRVDPSWPEPVSGWMDIIQDDVSTLTVGGARAQINAIWKSEILPACQQAVSGRYPFARSSSSEVPIDDFARVFAPGGMLDSFFTTHLRALVDTTGQRWRWRTVDNVSLGTSVAALAQFQRAATIRQAFFPVGAQPAVRFVLRLEEMDQQTNEVFLRIDGQVVSHNRIALARQFQLQWPGPEAGETRITFLPPPSPGGGDIAIRGPWALFRMLDRSQVRRETADRFQVTFAADGRSATFSLRAGSITNPFAMRELEVFRCPASL